MRLIRCLALAAFGLCAFVEHGSCFADPAVTAVDGRGVRVVLRKVPMRIVSLSPAVTETLFAIGAGSRVVGVTRYCDYPPAARRLPKVGDYTTSIERVLERRPDLVVADVEANRRALMDMERVAELRGKIFAVRQSSFGELFRSILGVGAVTGCQTRAARVVGDMRRTLALVHARVAKAAYRPKVLFVVEVQPLWVAGGKTFVDEMIEAAGGTNIGRKVGNGYRSMSVENLVALDPEVILSTHAKAADLRGRPGWDMVTAVRQRRIHTLGFEAVRPCPRLGDAVRRVSELLHPR